MTTPAFRRMSREISDGKILIPYLRASLSKPTFKGFKVPVQGWTNRQYDGWFHPSTHANWTARQLTYYITHGAEVPFAPPEMMFVLSVTQGSFWHEFVQRLLLEAGLLLENPGTTKRDSVNRRTEISLVDAVHNRRGHADGRREGELFEFKTASERVIAKLKTVEDLKKYKPNYYAQTQDYLDISGFPQMRYLVMQLSAPFAMEEFVVPADLGFQTQQRAKYREAIDAANEGATPDPCCHIGSKEAKGCPMRDFCPIGRIVR